MRKLIVIVSLFCLIIISLSVYYYLVIFTPHQKALELKQKQQQDQAAADKVKAEQGQQLLRDSIKQSCQNKADKITLADPNFWTPSQEQAYVDQCIQNSKGRLQQ